ncbi:MAG: PAS domain S-box protein, partial [Gammaproteobacteria bacterium]|nr:PAS domain S-box protein [Gammaproteobacteria bacterium]
MNSIPRKTDKPTRSLSNRFIFISIAIAILVWIAAYIAISMEENRGRQESREKSQRLAVFFEEHTLAIFRYGDAYLKMIRREYESSWSLDNVRNLMEAVPLNTSIASHVTIMDETGKPLLVSGHTIKPGSTARDRDYFLQQKNAETESLLISQPHLGRNSGILTIRLVRRLVKPDGNFGGVVFVAIKAEYITEFFNALGLGGKSSATLVGTDKKIRARSSYGQLGPGQDISDSRIWREIEKSPIGNYRQLSVVDGVTRNYSYRVLNEFPLVVAIGVSIDDSLQTLQQYKIFAYSISTLASFLIFITTLLFSQEINAREKLENSEKHTRIIVDTVLNGIISIDAEGCIDTFSRGATKIFGYDEDEVVGQPINRLSEGGDWFKIDSYLSAGDLESAHNPEEDIYFEVRARRKNGEVFPIEIAIGETRRNGKPMLVITAQDISEKKKAAMALFESEQRAQVTLQSIGDAVISTTADGIV